VLVQWPQQPCNCDSFHNRVTFTSGTTHDERRPAYVYQVWRW